MQTDSLTTGADNFTGMPADTPSDGGTQPAFAPMSNDFTDDEKIRRRAMKAATAKTLFQTDISKMDDAAVAGFYTACARGIFGIEDPDGKAAFGKRAGDARANVGLLRDFCNGNYSVIRDQEYDKWAAMDEEQKFRYALEHEGAAAKTKGWLAGNRGATLRELAGAGMPGAQFGNVFQNMAAPNRDETIRRVKYENLTPEEQKVYRDDVVGRYEDKLSKRQVLATYLAATEGLSDRAAMLLADTYNRFTAQDRDNPYFYDKGTVDVDAVESLPEDERDRFYTALSIMRGDQKKGHLLFMPADLSDDTALNRAQLALYGFQSSVLNLFSDTYAMGRDAAKWTYAKTVMGDEARRKYFRRWDAEQRAQRALEQGLPEADSWIGEMVQSLGENSHWFIPYGAIAKGGGLVKAGKAAKATAALRGEVAVMQKAAAEAGAAATAGKLGEVGVAAAKSGMMTGQNVDLWKRQMAAVEHFTQELRAAGDAARKADTMRKAGRSLWAAGQASAFSAFSEEYIANCDAAGISREESVPMSAIVGLVNAKIEQLYVPGLESSLTPVQVKSIMMASGLRALRSDGAAGFRKWVGNYVAKGVSEGVKVTLTEGAVEEPLQQLATEWGKEIAKSAEELRAAGQGGLGLALGKFIYDNFSADGGFDKFVQKNLETYVETAVDMVPSSVGFGLTTNARAKFNQHRANYVRRRQNMAKWEASRRAARENGMEEPAAPRMLSHDASGKLVFNPDGVDYDVGVADVVARAMETKDAISSYWESSGDADAKDGNRLVQAVTDARAVWRDGSGEKLQRVADACGVDMKTAEVVCQYLEAESEAAAYSPNVRAWTSIDFSSAEISEDTIRTVLPGYVDGSFMSDAESGTYAARVRIADGTERTIAYRVGDISAELVADVAENEKPDSAFGRSYDARLKQGGTEGAASWASLSDAERHRIAVDAAVRVNGFSSGRAGVLEMKDADGRTVRVNADDVIYLASGRLADVGYSAMAHMGTARHETFHSLWRFAAASYTDEQLQEMARVLGVDTASDTWRVDLDEAMAHQMEEYASGHYVTHVAETQLEKLLDSGAAKFIRLLSRFGLGDEVVNAKTGRPFAMADFYDAVLRGEIGSGMTGVEHVATEAPAPKAESSAAKGAGVPMEVSEAERAAASAELTASQAAAQEPATENAPAAPVNAAPKAGDTLDNPADASVTDAKFYRISAGEGVDIVGELVVSDARDLKTSYKGTLEDASLQNRGETEEGRALVEKISARPDPLQVGTVQPRANNGFIWSTPSGNVFIGNTRESGITKAYERGNAENVRAYMLAEAQRRGLEVPEGCEQPVVHFVLRRIESADGSATIQDVVRMTNESVNRGMNVYETARNDADVLVSNNLVPGIALRADGLVDTDRSAAAIGSFRRLTNAQGMIDENTGMLTEEGQTRLSNAVLAALLGNGNADLMRKIVSESARLDIENEKRALMRSAADLMDLAARKPEFDLRQPLAEALQYYVEWRDADETRRAESGKNRHAWYERTKDGARRRGLTWADHMAQQDMFRTPSADAKLLGDLLAASRDLRSFEADDRETEAGKQRAQRLVADYIGDYIRNARAVNTETVDMFGTPPASRTDVLEAQRTMDGSKRFSFVGIRPDGIEVYSTRSVDGMTNAERMAEFLRKLKEDYKGRTARFTVGRTTYYATFGGDDAGKIVHGDKKTSPRNRKIKDRIGASGDIFDLVENARYKKSREEEGKETDSHRDVEGWDYFDKTVQIDDGMYDVRIEVRRKPSITGQLKDEFVYNVFLNHSKKKADLSFLVQATTDAGDAAVRNAEATALRLEKSTGLILPPSDGTVNSENAGKKFSVVADVNTAAALDPAAVDLARFSHATEADVRRKIEAWSEGPEAFRLGLSREDVSAVLEETSDLLNAIHAELSGDANYDAFAKKTPTMRVDWRDGELKPTVSWVRGNIEYKYDMSADTLCINNEGLESVLASPTMADLMVHTSRFAAKNMALPKLERGYASDDYLRLYETLRDMGFVVPCKGCFDAAMRMKMLPSVAQKFVKLVNRTIAERNKNPEKFDAELRELAAGRDDAAVNGLPTKASTKALAIRIGVAGDNLTEPVDWTRLMSAEGQTQMLSDWGGIFRSWQRTGAGRPKDKLLPEPWNGVMVSSVSTIIAPADEKTPSFRDLEVNVGTGLRRNSHSEFRPILAYDEIQFMREAFLKRLCVFKYMKELDDVRLFGKLGVKFNMSAFPAFVPGGVAAGLDANGDYAWAEESVGGREFPYDGEDGKRHYDGARGLEEAKKFVNRDCSLSSVAFSVPHMIKLMTDVPTPSDPSGWVGSIIGFHNSGATKEALRMQGLGDERAYLPRNDFSVEAMTDYGSGVTNFEQVQNDRFGKGWKVMEGKRAGTDVQPGHKIEFANGTHYYNKAKGIHLYSSRYTLDSEGNKVDHPFVVDYNDKVREIGGDYAYKAAADHYVKFLRRLGLVPRFDFSVPPATFKEMCRVAKVDPHHPKLGWKGEGKAWSPCDAESYYANFCDYGMTDPATGKWAPHRPVGVVGKDGRRTFELPGNAVDIISRGVAMYSARKAEEDARTNDAVAEYCRREIAHGKMDPSVCADILRSHGFTDEQVAAATRDTSSFTDGMIAARRNAPENRKPVAAKRVKERGKGRFSYEFPRLDTMSDDELIAAAVASRIALGKSDKVSERSVKVTTVQRMMKSVHPGWDSRKIGVESVRVMQGAQKMAKRIREDLDRGVSDSLVLEHLPEAMRRQFGSEMRQQARQGARLGTFHQRAASAVEDRQARILEEAVKVQSGVETKLLENAYGVDLSQTLMNLVENPFLKKDKDGNYVPAGAGKQAAEDVTGVVQEDAPQKEVEEHVRRAVEEVVKTSARKRADEELARRNRENAAGHDAEVEAAMAAGSGDDGEASLAGADVVDIATRREGINLEDPRQLAHFVVELSRRYWIDSHGLKNDANVWADAVAVQFLRKTAANVYGKLAADIAYSQARATAARAIDGFENVPTVQGLLSEMTYVGQVINAKKIRETQQQLCEKLDLFLREKLGAQGRFKPDNEELHRKVSAEVELRARYMRHAMWLTPDAAAEEAKEIQREIDIAATDFEGEGHDVDQSRVMVEGIRKLNVLREFGALRYKPVGKIEEAISYWEDMERGSGEEIAREALDREVRTKKAAAVLARAFHDTARKYAREGRDFGAMLGDYMQSHMGLMNLLRDMTRFASDADAQAAENVFRWLELEIQKAGTAASVEKRRHADALAQAVKQIYGRDFAKVLSEFANEDDRFAPFMGTVDGQRVRPTKGRAIQLMVSLLQVGRKIEVEDPEKPGEFIVQWEGGYHDNIVKFHREAQAAQIAALLTPADLNLVKWLGQWYESNRQELSGVCESLFGIGVYAETSNYFPVKMLLEKQGLEKGDSVGWSIFPRALTPRVKNERDFDTSADVLQMFMSRMEEGAQWKAHARLGLEMRGIFGRADLQAAISASHGAKANATVLGFVTDTLSGQGTVDRGDNGATYYTDIVRGWAALGALGANVGVMVRQPTSIPAFGFEIGLVKTAKHMATAFTPEGIDAMRRIFDSEQRKVRWATGNTEAVKNALASSGSGPIMRLWKASMVTNKIGDVVPALVVGQGIYRECLGNGMSEEDAMAYTWMLVERTQQSSRIENQAQFQRRSKYGRAIYQFLSTQQQYLQYELRAVRAVMAKPGDASRWAKLGGTLALNHFILSSAYFWVGAMFRRMLGQEPPEDELKDWTVSMLLGPYGALYGLGITCTGALNEWIKGPQYGGTSSLPSLSYVGNVIVRDPAAVVKAILDDGSSWDDVLEKLGKWAADQNALFRDMRKIKKNYFDKD